jgi:hypothetical protein
MNPEVGSVRRAAQSQQKENAYNGKKFHAPPQKPRELKTMHHPCIPHRTLPITAPAPMTSF